MRKRNPLFYDISKLKEESFRRRSLARYRKDLDKSKKLKRGRVPGSVGSLKRKAKLQKWFPNTDVYIFDLESSGILDAVFDNYAESDNIFDTGDALDFMSFNPSVVRQYFGIRNPTAIVVLIDVDLVTQEPEAWTPFMMVHDWGEDIVATFQMYPPEGFEDLWRDMQSIIYQEQMYSLYIPKLVHVQPWPHVLKPTRYGYDLDAMQAMEESKSITPFLDYVLDLTGNGGNNLFSDVWALWCKREYISPSQFWPIKETYESTIAYLDSVGDEKRKQKFMSFVQENYNDLDIRKYCNELNIQFTRLLNYFKGRTVLIRLG